MTVTETALPAVRWPGDADDEMRGRRRAHVHAAAAAGRGQLPSSVAVIVWLPAVFKRDSESASAIDQHGIGGQDRRRVAAGELDRAGVGRRRIVVRVLGRDGESDGIARGVGGAATTTKCVAAATDTLTAAAAAGDRSVRRVGGGDGLVARPSSAWR